MYGAPAELRLRPPAPLPRCQANAAIAATGAIVGFLFAMTAWSGANAGVGASDWQNTDHTQARLIAAESATGSDGTVRLGLHLRLDPGWKTYWRSPGDAGFPPIFDWSDSDNLADAKVDWPLPERFTLYGLETFGYQDEVVLPVTVRLARPGAPTRLRLVLQYAACANVCVPYQAFLALDLPAGPARATPYAPLIARYAFRVPNRAEDDGLAVLAAVARGVGRDKSLEVVATTNTSFTAPDLIVEAPGQLLFSRPNVQVSDDRRRAVFQLAVDSTRSARPLAGVALVITLIDGERAIERTIVAVPGS